MYWLGRCHLAGIGMKADERAGMDWIARAASHDHVAARAMVAYLYDPARPTQSPAELEAALDTIERSIVLAALADSSGRETARGEQETLRRA